MGYRKLYWKLFLKTGLLLFYMEYKACCEKDYI